MPTADQIQTEAQELTEIKWGSLTLSSLVKASVRFTLTLDGRAKSIAQSFATKVESSHSWLLDNRQPPVADLFVLVKISDLLKQYTLTGDDAFLDAAEKRL